MKDNAKAGWEVEGFIDRLTRRDDTNSERLVLEAVRHLRAFSRDCDALRGDNRELRDEIAALRSAVCKILLPENAGKYPHYLDAAEKAAFGRAMSDMTSHTSPQREAP